MKTRFQDIIIDAVKRLGGRATLDELVQATGYLVDASLAASYGRSEERGYVRDYGPRKVPLKVLVERGRRFKVGQAARNACRRGLLRRIGRGVWCLPLRLVKPEAG